MFKGCKFKNYFVILTVIIALEGISSSGQSQKTAQKEEPQAQATRKVFELKGTLAHVDLEKNSLLLEPSDKGKSSEWGSFYSSVPSKWHWYVAGKSPETGESTQFLKLHPTSNTTVVNNEGKALDLSSLVKGQPVLVKFTLNPDGRPEIIKVAAQITCTPDFCAFGKCARKCGAKSCQCGK